MCTYTYAPLCAVRGNTGVEKEETLLPLRPPPGSRPPVTCSPLILFSLTVPVVFLSPSIPCSFATRFIFPLPPSVSLFCLCALSRIIVSYRFSRSPCLSSLSSSPVPSFVTMHLVSPTATTPICCCFYVVAADETLRCTRICARKKRTPVSNIKANICLNPRYTLNGY